MIMRTAKLLLVPCLVFLGISGAAFSSTDPAPAAGPGAGRGGGGVSDRFEGIESLPVCACSDIAYTDLFRSEGLGYVTSAEFAKAIRAVASGESRYSPAEIPGAWRVAAADWGASRSGTAVLKFLEDREACIPALIYLASMEYRSSSGRRDVKPAFPLFVREATRDLAARAAAKRDLAVGFAKRENAIAAKIREAERMGAGECAPGAVASARTELERARRKAVEIRFSLKEAESGFRNAERSAETILTWQQFAAKTGRRCYAE